MDRLTCLAGSGGVLSLVGVALAVFVLGVSAVALAPQGSPVAAWWPAAGVSVAAVAASPRARRHAMLGVIASASVAANVVGGRPLLLAACFAVANVAEAAVAGSWLGRGGRPALRTLADLGRLLAAALAGGLLAAGIAATAVSVLAGAPLWSTWWSVGASHGAAVLLLVPLVARPPEHGVVSRPWERVVQWIATLTVLAVVFSPSQRLPLAFLVVLVLVWAGLRLGVRAAAVQLLVVGVLATVLTAQGGGPFAQAGRASSPVVTGALVQLFLLACGLVVLTLAVTVAQREAAVAQVLDSGRFLDALVDTLDVGIIAVDAQGRPTMFNRLTREMHGPVTDGLGGDGSQPGGWCRAQDVPSRFSLLRADGSGPLAVQDVPITRVLAEGQLHGAELIVARDGHPARHLLVHGRQIHAQDGTLLGAVTAAHDVTELKRHEADLQVAMSALADQRDFHAAVLEVVNVGVSACDADGTIVLRNAAQRRLTGVRDGELPSAGQLAVGLTVLQADGSDLPQERWPLRRTLAGEAITDLPLRTGRVGTELRDFLVTGRQIHGADGRLLGAVTAATDVTQERAVQARLRDSAAFHDAVLAASPDFIYVVDALSNAVVWASRNLTALLGYSQEQVIDLGDRVVEALVHPDDAVRLEAANSAARGLPNGEVLAIRYRLKNSAAQYRWFARRITPFARDDQGQVRQLLGVARDITDTVAVEDRLTEIALHDALTGLPNRRLLSDRLATALRGTARSGGQVAVLFCDLDGFKHVNDTAGHGAGDTLLIAIADRLRAVLRPEDTIARVGGDEFVIVIDPTRQAPGRAGAAGRAAEVGHAEVGHAESRARVVARRITQAVREPVVIDGTTHVVTVSIGVAFAGDGDDPEATLRDADSAMYQAKVLGKNRMVLFDSTLRQGAVDRGRVESALRDALSDPAPRGGPGSAALSVAYQPILDLRTQRLVGVEALARLHDQQGLAVPPDVFIPVAEDCGLIGSLGRRVLDTACADVARWHAAYPAWRHLQVAVNLSARQLGLTGLVAEVDAALRRNSLAAGLLTLELTESVLLEASRPAMTALRALRALGVRIVVDDFGTGYASLRYLAEFPVTGVKIDRSFTAGLPDDPTSGTIVRAVASLARDLGLTCVAEGIETDAQLLALPAGLAGQGFLLGHPTTAALLEERLAGRADVDSRPLR